jgi:hypothetical protein
MLIRMDGPNNRHALINVVCLLKSNAAHQDSDVCHFFSFLSHLFYSPLFSHCSPSFWTMWLQTITIHTTTSHCSPRKGKDVTCKLSIYTFVWLSVGFDLSFALSDKAFQIMRLSYPVLPIQCVTFDASGRATIVCMQYVFCVCSVQK